MLLVLVEYIGLIDTIIRCTEVVLCVLIVQLGRLLEETIVLRLKGHDLCLLSGHAINSVDELREVLFLTLAFVHLIV